MPPNRQDFQKCLDSLLETAKNDNLLFMDVKAADLHRLVGGYPNNGNHRMPICCSVMRDAMKKSDEELPNSLMKDGATLKIRYHFSST